MYPYPAFLLLSPSVCPPSLLPSPFSHLPSFSRLFDGGNGAYEADGSIDVVGLRGVLLRIVPGASTVELSQLWKVVCDPTTTSSSSSSSSSSFSSSSSAATVPFPDFVAFIREGSGGSSVDGRDGGDGRDQLGGQSGGQS